MELPLRRPPGDLLSAVTRALAAPAAASNTADDAASTVVARAVNGGRSLEVVCVGPLDVVSALAPVAGEFGVELVVRQVDGVDDPAIHEARDQGGLVVVGSLPVVQRSPLADAPA